MSKEITVGGVVEENDCLGRKSYYVTEMAYDENIKSYYRLYHGWLPPEDKLALTTVVDGDKVEIRYDAQYGQRVVEGEYLNIQSPVFTRIPSCYCKTVLVSDGFDIYCPNHHCPLTTVARLKRLASVQFFDHEDMIYTPDVQININSDQEFENFARPFRFITNTSFWGAPGGSLEHVLERDRLLSPSLSTFLIPDLFAQFLENSNIPQGMANAAGVNISHFYGRMDETINRRSIMDDRQDLLLKAFLYSLGIESLQLPIIDAMIFFEKNLSISDPMVIYSHILTHPQELIKEFHLHPVEAASITREVKNRAYELHDIFYHYALNRADVTLSFNRLMKRQT